MPNLIANYQKKQTAAQLKKFYAELSQAVERSKAVNGDIELWDFTITSANFFNTYLSSFMKISGQSVGDARANGMVYYSLSGAKETALTTMYNNSKIVVLASGTQVFLSDTIYYAYDEKRKRKGVTVDINGFKKPNKFGKDIFSFVITPTKGVTAHYFDDLDLNTVTKTRNQLLNGPSQFNYQCNKNGRGLWCSALIMMDGWEIKNDYPW